MSVQSMRRRLAVYLALSVEMGIDTDMQAELQRAVEGRVIDYAVVAATVSLLGNLAWVRHIAGYDDWRTLYYVLVNMCHMTGFPWRGTLYNY